jgi:hypothetical protein
LRSKNINENANANHELSCLFVEKGVPVQPNEKTRIYERASAGEQTFTTTTARSKNASTVGTAAVSFEQL